MIISHTTSPFQWANIEGFIGEIIFSLHSFGFLESRKKRRSFCPCAGERLELGLLIAKILSFLIRD